MKSIYFAESSGVSRHAYSLFLSGMLFVGCSPSPSTTADKQRLDLASERGAAVAATAGVSDRGRADPAVDAAAQQLAEAGVELTRKANAIVEVNFGDVLATDALAEAAARLGEVIKLTVRESQMSEAGWSRLGELAKLEQIDIRDCAITNPQFLALTANLPQLKAVRLSGKSGRTVVDDAGLANLGKCSKLKLVAVDGLWISGDGLQHLAGCGEIVELYLAGTLIDDAALELVAGFPKLAKVRLAKTSVSGQGLAGLASLPLTELDLSECTQVLDAAMPAVAQLQGLKRLNLWRNTITNGGVAELAPLTNLEWLNLDNTHMGDEALKHLGGMKKLTFLHLGSTAVTNAGMPELVTLTALRDLKVTRTAVTEEGVEPLRAALPDLDIQIKYVEGE
jgi:hypothetical protein